MARPTGAQAAASRSRSAPSSQDARQQRPRQPSTSPTGTSRPLTSSLHDLRHATHGGRDYRHSDRERLDRRVREVLPGAREQRRLGAGDERRAPRPAAATRGTSNAPVRRSARATASSLLAVGAVADDDEARAGDAGDRLDGHLERLLARQPADERRTSPAARAPGVDIDGRVPGSEAPRSRARSRPHSPAIAAR